MVVGPMLWPQDVTRTGSSALASRVWPARDRQESEDEQRGGEGRGVSAEISACSAPFVGMGFVAHVRPKPGLGQPG